MAKRFAVREISYRGSGAILTISKEARERGLRKAFICSERELFTSGITERVLELLAREKMEFAVFCEFHARPTADDRGRAAAAFGESDADYVMGVGRDGAMELARGLREDEPVFCSRTPLFLVPAGADTALRVLGSHIEGEWERLVFVDPRMMLSLPSRLAAVSGMAALARAIEGCLAPGAWELSDLLHLKAVEIIARSLRGAVEGEAEDREDMLLAQWIAGQEHFDVGAGLAEAMAGVLNRYCDIPLGLANAAALPVVLESGCELPEEKFGEIAEAMGERGAKKLPPGEARRSVAAAYRRLAREIGIPDDLAGLAPGADLAFLSRVAGEEAYGRKKSAPSGVGAIEGLYRKLL